LTGFEEAEMRFTEDVRPKGGRKGNYDTSGACALVVMIIDDMCYVANLGDSRALLSEDNGAKLTVITRDHKPNDEIELQRIESNGGYIFRYSYIYIGSRSRVIVSSKSQKL
jgi:protein phosphatase 2C family protein 2/3